MNIEISFEPFDPWKRLASHESRPELARGSYGAAVAFVGTMRDFNEGDDVKAMRLEHYPGMTEKHLEQIASAALERWPLNDVLIVHRVGLVTPGDPIVLVATWSAHRSAAYEANRYIMEDLKSRAPFWKKEQLNEGERWVESNTPG